MKMSSRSQSFVKQVQVDLLALNDADLLQTIHEWINESNSSVLPLHIQKEIRSALGYTHILAETNTLPHLFSAPSETDSEGLELWLAPSPDSLRALITAMNVNSFVQYVITLAFQSLHTIYPEWYEGTVFNAHLANHLRQMKRRTADAGLSIHS